MQQQPPYPPMPPPMPQQVPYGVPPEYGMPSAYGYAPVTPSQGKVGKIGLIIGVITLLPWLGSWLLIAIASGTHRGGQPRPEEFMLAFAIMGCIGLALLLAVVTGIMGIIACATSRPQRPANFICIGIGVVVFFSYAVGMAISG